MQLDYTINTESTCKPPETWSSYLGDPRLELVRLFAIRLHYLGAGTEHGRCV